jgi:glycosyltransferase involved in cell wall biosynthesis
MKIVMLSARFPPTLGGAEIQCYRLSQWLARHGHEVLVLTEKSNSQETTSERVEGFQVIRFRTWGPLPFSSICYGLQALFYLLRNRRFDVLHAHMLATPAMVALAVKFMYRTPVLIKITGRQQLIHARLKWWFVKLMKPYVVCPSQNLLKEVLSVGIPADTLFYGPNGVDAEHFKPSVSSGTVIPSPLPWSRNLPTAIYVGRWAKGKGVEKILDVWEKGVLQSEFPWHLVMILSSKPSDELASRLKRLEGRVYVAIDIKDPLPYYQASDLAILLSESEGMSNFLLEAMACGIPTLTTAAAALPESSGVLGGTCTIPTSEDTVSAALRHLLDLAKNNEKRLSMSRCAREFIEQRFAFDRIGPSYLDLYRKMQS